MNCDVKKILELSVNAPSGHNSQPWKFSISENTVDIWNVPEKDDILFNYMQRGSLIAHGALIENIVIISSKLGWHASFNLFPNREDDSHVAKVSFTRSEQNYKYDHLFDFIEARVTNRKKYKRDNLSNEHINTVTNNELHDENELFNLFFTTQKSVIIDLADLFSVGDRMVFENQAIHESLFSNVNWTLAEEERKKEGLYVKTKELSWPIELIFRFILSNWEIVKYLKKINLATKAQKIRRNVYKESAGVGILTAPDLTNESLITCGRIMQRLWLTTTQKNIAFQPLTVGLIYLGQKVQDNPNSQDLNKLESQAIRDSYNKICNIVNKEVDGIPVFSFRLGYASHPKAHSKKKIPYLINN